MRLQRLLDLSPAELVFRGRQEAFKALERLSVADSRRRAGCRFDRSAIDVPLRELLDGRDGEGAKHFDEDLQRYLQGRMSERFFAGAGSGAGAGDVQQALTDDFATGARQVIARADAVCRQRFEILGYGELSFGSPVNWHLDPVSGRESLLVHWSRLDPLQPEQVGDSKVVWELNRHQWMLDLGQAYRLTGDEDYAEAFIALVTDWLEHNPYGRGINWSSALEVAMRLISWCWALSLFKDSPALTPLRFEALLASLQEHAGFVERYLSRYFSPNTHLTVEALALYYTGTLLPELRGARRWRTRGREVLLEQLPVQVTDSGVYFEQSTRYQYYTVEIYLHFAILAARNGDVLPAQVHERLGAMLRYLLALRRPDGTVPQIGDTDGGWLCPLVHREVGDYRGLFAAAAVLLEDSQLAWAAGGLTPEALWLLGPEAGPRFKGLTRGEPSVPPLVTNVPGACVTMRSDWSRHAHQLIFDTGPLGCRVSGGHGHADLLAVQCSAFGENYLVDPGTGCYLPGSPWRQYFRSTRAHSTVLVDGLDQAVTAGPFSWLQRPAARLLDFESAPGQVFAAAQHDAYARLADPVTHRRRVWFLDSAAWLIVDDLFGAMPHRVDLRFQFAPLPVTGEVDGWIRARGQASSLLMKTFSAQALHTELVAGGREPLRGWFSPNYGRMVPAPALTLSADGELPLRLATLIIPRRDPDAAPPLVTPRILNGLLTGLSISDSKLEVPDFGADALSPSHGKRLTS